MEGRLIRDRALFERWGGGGRALNRGYPLPVQK